MSRSPASISKAKSREERYAAARKAVEAGEPITGRQLALLDYPEPCELVEGQIKPMAPTFWEHGRIEATLAQNLSNFVQEHDLGEVMTGEAGLYTGRDPDTVRGADVLFISHERLAKATPNDYLDVAPELVVEILSPSNSWEGMRRKIEEYLAIGVERVWIVEPENRAVLVYRAPGEAETLSEGDTLRGDGKLEGFSLPVQRLFDR